MTLGNIGLYGTRITVVQIYLILRFLWNLNACFSKLKFSGKLKVFNFFAHLNPESFQVNLNLSRINYDMLTHLQKFVT